MGKREQWAKDPRYNIWANIKQRCYNAANPAYPRYGGRGIALLASWHDFTTFAEAVGERPIGLTLDRIDNDRGYEPGNVRWATYQAQNRNRRHVRVSPEIAAAVRLKARSLVIRERIPKGARQSLMAEYGLTIHMLKDVLMRRSWGDA